MKKKKAKKLKTKKPAPNFYGLGNLITLSLSFCAQGLSLNN